MMRFVVLFVIAIWIEMSQEQQMIPQCKCSEIAPCQEAAVQSVLPCADQCQKFITSIGGNYDQISDCFKQKQTMIQGAMKCAHDAFPDACAKGEPKMIPKRFTKGLQLAFLNDVNKELQRMGIANQVTQLLSQGRRFFKCFQSCMMKKLNKCTPNCGLDLPADSVLVKTIKECTQRNGIQTATVQDLCFCVEKAGIRQLADVCPRVNIFQKK